MPQRRTTLTILVLLLAVAGIFIALVVETSRGPVFRAADYGSLDECVANIPEAWRPGSLDYMRAQGSCNYTFGGGRPEGR